MLEHGSGEERGDERRGEVGALGRLREIAHRRSVNANLKNQAQDIAHVLERARRASELPGTDHRRGSAGSSEGAQRGDHGGSVTQREEHGGGADHGSSSHRASDEARDQSARLVGPLLPRSHAGADVADHRRGSARERRASVQSDGTSASAASDGDAGHRRGSRSSTSGSPPAALPDVERGGTGWELLGARGGGARGTAASTAAAALGLGGRVAAQWQRAHVHVVDPGADPGAGHGVEPRRQSARESGPAGRFPGWAAMRGADVLAQAGCSDGEASGAAPPSLMRIASRGHGMSAPRGLHVTVPAARSASTAADEGEESAGADSASDSSSREKIQALRHRLRGPL
jgi:hypothetical protein